MANQGFSRRMNNYKERFHKNRRLRRVSVAVAICLACVATVALMIPAVTLEYAKPACGMEEHTHTDACYSRELVCSLPDTGAHVHSPECYDPDTLELICEEEATGHLHVPACLNANGVVACGIEETVHVHGPECYTLVQPEVTEGAEGDESVEPVEPAAPEYILTCTKESAGHVHSSMCLDAAGNLICGEEEEVVADHEHGDSCYQDVPVCGHEEHVHTDLCFDEISSEVLKDKERKELEDGNTEVVDEVQAGSAIPADELAALMADGLVYENDSMILALEAPEDLDGELKVRITENGVDSVGASTEPADAQPEGDVADDGNADPAGTSTDLVEAQDDAAAQAADSENATDPAILSEAKDLDPQSTQEDTPAWATTLNIEATLDGEPVEDIASLGLTAKLQLKPALVQPILDGINYEEVAEEAKADVGAELVITQNTFDEEGNSLSTPSEDEVSEVLITDTNNVSTTFELLSNEMDIQAGKVPNPTFSVLYYANLKRVNTDSESSNKLSVIDTSVSGLPTNGSIPATTELPLVGSNNKYVVDTIDELTEVYNQRSFKYHSAPNLKYFDALQDNDGYQLQSISVSYDGGETWNAHAYDANTTHFTNRDVTAAADQNYIYITENTMLRLEYDCNDKTKYLSSLFHDYDISDGNLYKSDYVESGIYEAADTNKKQYNYTLRQGINNDGNYTESYEEAKDISVAHYGFGNTNAGSGLDTQKLNGYPINAANRNANNFQLCSFGLVESELGSNGLPSFTNGVSAPTNLFGGDKAIGKTTFSDYNLGFKQVGDTYTLTSVTQGSGANSQTVLSNLDSFQPYKVGNTIKFFSNEFWAMDKVPYWGNVGHDMKFGASKNRWYFGEKEQEAFSWSFPSSDFGKDRNAYFGMEYEVKFNLDKDYVGPLEYLFFGDDDMWVYLDGKLICDIGGVHSATGEYVDLWKHIKDETGAALTHGDGQEHSLKFFYTERGASGSTCFMQFTLPSVIGTQSTSTSSLKVEKQISGNGYDPDDVFEFEIGLSKDGQPLVDDFAYSKYKNGQSDPIESDIILWDHATFSIKGDEYVIIDYLPLGTQYTVTEKKVNGKEGDYEPFVRINNEDIDAHIATGTITEDQPKVRFVNARNALPETGGIGAEWFWVGGGLIMTFAIVAYTRGKTRRRGEVR